MFHLVSSLDPSFLLSVPRASSCLLLHLVVPALSLIACFMYSDFSLVLPLLVDSCVFIKKKERRKNSSLLKRGITNFINFIEICKRKKEWNLLRVYYLWNLLEEELTTADDFPIICNVNHLKKKKKDRTFYPPFFREESRKIIGESKKKKEKKKNKQKNERSTEILNFTICTQGYPTFGIEFPSPLPYRLQIRDSIAWSENAKRAQQQSMARLSPANVPFRDQQRAIVDMHTLLELR